MFACCTVLDVCELPKRLSVALEVGPVTPVFKDRLDAQQIKVVCAKRSICLQRCLVCSRHPSLLRLLMGWNFLPGTRTGHLAGMVVKEKGLVSARSGRRERGAALPRSTADAPFGPCGLLGSLAIPPFPPGIPPVSLPEWEIYHQLRENLFLLPAPPGSMRIVC